jgi:uncharacterized protein (DUF433 family)
LEVGKPPARSIAMPSRITVDPQVCSGKPIIRGTRIMVKNILGMVAGGYTIDRILAAYPELSRDDVTDAIAYASQIVDEEKVILRG